MYTCVLCRLRREGESPAILFVSKYGAPKNLCPDCENLIDTATGEDEAKAQKARTALAEVTAGLRDREAIRVLQSVLDGVETEEEDSAIEEAYEELRMTDEEKRAEEEEEKKRLEKESSLLSWLPVILAGAACVAFVVYWFFLR